MGPSRDKGRKGEICLEIAVIKVKPSLVYQIKAKCEEREDP